MPFQFNLKTGTWRDAIQLSIMQNRPEFIKNADKKRSLSQEEMKELDDLGQKLQEATSKLENWTALPHAPGVFKEAWKPVTSLEMQIKQQLLEPQHYEVVLQISATTKLQERTAFTIEVHQAGIFKCEGFDEKTLAYLLNAQCPTLLYPYLCRAMSDAAVQAGFPPLLLALVDFNHSQE